MNTTIVDVLIENIKTDLELQAQADDKIERAKTEKKEVADRLKGYRTDLTVMLKYADGNQRKKIEELGFDLSEPDRGMNPIASFVLDTVMKAKGNQLSNGELYEAYTKTAKAKKQEPENYTQFNIKCRTLFNTQRLLRKKGKDPKNTREDMIYLNGRVLEKDTAKAENKK